MAAGDSVRAFYAARGFLFAHRDDYDTAYRDFRWPELDTFNWALDHFDAVAADPVRGARRALWIVEQDGSEAYWTFAELAARSNRVANRLREWGVRRGDRIVLMLGNQVELWETLLAAMKLGAVVIPATTQLRAADVRDRLDRGGARHVVVAASATGAFADVPGDYTRIAVGGAPDGWLDYGTADAASPDFTPDGVTRADDPLLLYFTSGTTARPKLVEHTHASYPVGHLSTMYWIGLEPGDVHLNISSPGWAKHAWSNVFAPWCAEACVLVMNYARFDAPGVLDVLDRCAVTSFCAPPTVWRMLIQADLSGLRRPPTKVVGAGEPLNPEVIEQVERAWGVRIRDGFGQTETTVQIANTPGQPVKPGSMGRPVPGYTVALIDPATGAPADEGEICLDLKARPLGLMVGYAGDPALTAGATADGYYHTGDVGKPRCRRLHHLRRPRGRRVQGQRLPDLPVRAGERADRAPGRRRGGGGALAGPAAAGRPQGVRRARRRVSALGRDRPVHPGVRPRPPRALPAHPPPGVRGAAQDALGQDPSRRAAGPGEGAFHRSGTLGGVHTVGVPTLT